MSDLSDLDRFERNVMRPALTPFRASLWQVYSPACERGEVYDSEEAALAALRHQLADAGHGELVMIRRTDWQR